MAETEVIVLCYWNGCIKYGPDGLSYEGSTSKKIRVKRKTELSRLVDALYLITGFDKKRSKFDIIGRYPSVVQNSMVKKYVPLPVGDDASLETMLEVPSIHPCIKYVEFYLEVKSPLANPGRSSKRQRTQQEKTDTNLDGCLSEVVNSGVPKPCLVSSLWIDDDNELRVGLCFKDRDELKKAVDWCSIRGRRKCVVKETEKDMYTFECVRWKCKWSLWAVKREEHGAVEITKYTGPHTCCPEEPEVFESEFAADEIERVVRVHPTLSISELKKWWNEKTGYKLKTPEMKAAKLEAMQKIYGDWDQSFRVLPKLMAALQSSNGLVVDWLYDVFPNPEFASFRGVFWAFSQAIEGFPHCKPLIIVESKDFNNGKYPMTLMVASGVDAAFQAFPLAFAVTKEVSSEIWRWFFTEIREKVTQRKGLCLISSPHPDILAVINEPESRWKEPWAYHRFCLNHLCSQFHDIFKDDYLKNLVDEAGSTAQEDEFDSDMKDIEKKNPEARRWLDQFPPHQWALAHDNGRRYGIMTIEKTCKFEALESVELFGLTIAMLRLFDDARNHFNICCKDNRGLLNCGYAYSKPVMDKIAEFRTASVTYIVTPLARDAFHIAESSENEEWIVQLNDSICTCGEFQACKFPCLHALAVCDKLKINPLQSVDDCYTLERHYKTYSAKFNPVPEVSAWPEASGVPRLVPPCPPNGSGKSKPEATLRMSKKKT